MPSLIRKNINLILKGLGRWFQDSSRKPTESLDNLVLFKSKVGVSDPLP